MPGNIEQFSQHVDDAVLHGKELEVGWLNSSNDFILTSSSHSKTAASMSPSARLFRTRLGLPFIHVGSADGIYDFDR